MSQPTLLCLSSYFKGEAFLRQAKKEGARVLLLTEEKLAHEKWPRDSIDEVFLMPDMTKVQDLIYAISYLFRSNKIDQIIALDEYDVENVATLREHLRLPGMGQTHTRYFRDKLAMRMRARANGVRVPSFTSVFNYDMLREFMDKVPAPWVLKPRTEASSMGIKKIHNSEELWRWFDQLGDQQSAFLLEQFVPGDVFHVDSVIWDGKIVFSSTQKYGIPPFSVYHDGGIFTTQTVSPKSKDAQALKAINAALVKSQGMEHGVTHAEYIKGHADGEMYFLEVAARVGGANIADLIEHTTGINPWAEWARVEIATIRGEAYKPPKPFQKYGALVNTLAKQEYPDLSAYNDPEIVWKADHKQHAGLIAVSDKAERVNELIESYIQRFSNDFLAVATPKESAH
ncbi:MAG: ATP-grasp domain-containing protein [Chloroflexi bacterium]|nr:ATP-grasp domain-containing protein [Chloroflexota bacterium]MCC6893470.1 ATP-grasp domain-containing protein [Anaerolineae bacterium]